MTKRLVWRPNDKDVAIMEALARLSDDEGSCVIGHLDLAREAEVPVNTLATRLRWLESFGYLKREDRYPGRERGPLRTANYRLWSRYVIVRMPTPDDVHDVGAYEPRPAPEGRVGPHRRVDVDPAEVKRLYDDERLSIRAIADRLGISYGTTHRIVTEQTTPRPHGGARRYERVHDS